MEKLCVFCKHFDFEAAGYRYYSTLTGGDVTGGISCKKLHYTKTQPSDKANFRAVVLHAESCPDYEQDI